VRVIRFAVLSVLLLCAARISVAQGNGVGPSSPAPLTITFGERSVQVSGPPGGQVVLFGIAREFTMPKVPVLGVVRRAIVLSDSAKSGRFTLDLGEAPPQAALWVAVDLGSGAHAVAASRGYAPVQALVPAETVKHDNVGQLNKFEFPASEMDVMVVRPGEGAWHLYAAKRGKRDENAALSSRTIRIDVSAMEPLGSSAPAPKSFKNGDVIAVIDPHWMNYGLIEVGK